MPFTRDSYQLPFSGRTPQSRQNSYRAAIAQRSTRGTKKCRMLAYIREHGEATDQELAEGLDLPLQSICSLRCSLRDQGLVRHVGNAVGIYGKTVSVWGPVETAGREEGW